MPAPTLPSAIGSVKVRVTSDDLPGFYEDFDADDPNKYSVYPTGGANFKKAQRDNITSFAGGQTLGDSLPD